MCFPCAKCLQSEQNQSNLRFQLRRLHGWMDHDVCIHASANHLEPPEEKEAVLPPVSLHISLPLAVHQAFHFPPHKPPLSFFPSRPCWIRIGSESSNGRVYMKHFSSDGAFTLVICVHVNIAVVSPSGSEAPPPPAVVPAP